MAETASNISSTNTAVVPLSQQFSFMKTSKKTNSEPAMIIYSSNTSQTTPEGEIRDFSSPNPYTVPCIVIYTIQKLGVKHYCLPF